MTPAYHGDGIDGQSANAAWASDHEGSDERAPTTGQPRPLSHGWTRLLGALYGSHRRAAVTPEPPWWRFGGLGLVEALLALLVAGGFARAEINEGVVVARPAVLAAVAVLVERACRHLKPVPSNGPVGARVLRGIHV